MHFYACPYCDPCETAKLIKIKLEEQSCKYKKEKDCEEKHKCKEVLRCEKCKSSFKISKKFLEEQKRKIKDG